MVKKAPETNTEPLSSAGHRLGQIVGDWWETKVIFPMLCEVSDSLGLFLDNRIVQRECRKEKVQWPDNEENYVDYDFVLELGGSAQKRGIPVAFLESFWRRGARHSKDKARDDTNKLLPMRSTYPTARFLAIAACGEFTEPAREYVRSRSVELFFISKEKIIEAFSSIDINIDYPDSLPENKKMDLVRDLEKKFDEKAQNIASKNLRDFAGQAAFNSFKQRISSSLTATPQEIRIFSLARFGPMIFQTIESAADFLGDAKAKFPSKSNATQYEYEVSFSDGSEFSRSLNSLLEVKEVNSQLLKLVEHFKNF